MLGMIDQQLILNIASRVLQLQASPSPTPTAITPSRMPDSNRDIIIPLVVVVVLLAIILVALVALPVGCWIYQSRR